MRYFKSNDEIGNLSRIDCAETNVSNGEEIQHAEFYSLKVAIRVFKNKESPANISAKDWGLSL